MYGRADWLHTKTQNTAYYANLAAAKARAAAAATSSYPAPQTSYPAPSYTPSLPSEQLTPESSMVGPLVVAGALVVAVGGFLALRKKKPVRRNGRRGGRR